MSASARQMKRLRELPRLLRQAGLILLLSYCLFSIYNVLYLREVLDFIGLLLLGMAGVYALQRLALMSARGLKVSRSECYAVALIGILGVSIVAQQAFLTTYVDPEGTDTLGYVRTIAKLAVIWVLIGGALSMFELPESSFWAIALSLVILMLFLPSFTEDAAVGYAEIRDETGLTGLSHLILEPFVIVPLTLAYALSVRTRLVVVLVSFGVLFMMSGRTAMVSFMLTVFIMSLQGRAIRNLLVLGVAGIVIFGGARYVVEAGLVDTDSRAIREMLFIGGIEEDDSFLGRKELLAQGIKDLPGQFLYGNFTLTTEHHGYFGAYIHNLLSAWQMFGFFVFAAIIVGLTICAGRARAAMTSAPTPSIVFGTFLLVYVIINVTVAKSILWSVMWLVLGFWLLRPGASSGTRRRRRRRRSGRGRSFVALQRLESSQGG